MQANVQHLLQNREKLYIWLTVGLSLALALWVQWPRIQNPTLVEEDMRTLFWLRSYQDATLFPHAPYAERGVTRYQLGALQLAVEDGSPGYSLLLFAGAQLTDPVLFSKLLVFPLTAVTAFFAFQIGARLRGKGEGALLGLALTGLMLASSTAISLDSGLHRSFALPALLALLWYLMNRHYGRAAGVLAIVGVIYLPIFPVGAITFFLSLVRWRDNGRLQPRIAVSGMIPLAAAVLFVSISVSPLIFERATAVSAESDLHLLQEPHFGPDGRQSLFAVFPVAGRAGIVKEGIDLFHFIVLVALFLFVWGFSRKDNPLPSVFRSLFVACWIGYILSWLSIIVFSSFLLYLPNRHTRFGFILLLVVYVMLNGKAAVQAAARWFRAQKERLLWYAAGVTAVLLALALLLPPPESGAGGFMRGSSARILLVSSGLLLVLLSFMSARRQRPLANDGAFHTARAFWSGKSMLAIVALPFLFLPYLSLTNHTKFYQPTAEQLALFSWLETLPKDVVLAGDPCGLDSVQFFAGRDVLFSCERFEFLADAEQIVMDDLRAYYASDSRVVAEFCQRYEVDYLLVNEMHFSPEWLADGKFFFEPYNSQLAAEIGGRTHFALNEIPQADRQFSVGDYSVVACDYFRESVRGGPEYVAEDRPG